MVSQPPRALFKRLNVENWKDIDPVWGHFGFAGIAGLDVFGNPSQVQLTPPEAWVNQVLSITLDLSVPLAIRELFDVARGVLIYGLFFFPVLTIGTEQIYRVLEAAVTNKCKEINAPSGIGGFFGKLKWLTKTGVIQNAQYRRWDAVRALRDLSSHPRAQNIDDPNIAVHTLSTARELIHELYSVPPLVNIPCA